MPQNTWDDLGLKTQLVPETGSAQETLKEIWQFSISGLWNEGKSDRDKFNLTGNSLRTRTMQVTPWCPPASWHMAHHKASPPRMLAGWEGWGEGTCRDARMSRDAGTPRSDLTIASHWGFPGPLGREEARLLEGDSQCHLPHHLALTSEADTQPFCVGRNQELFPLHFIFITNCVPRTWEVSEARFPSSTTASRKLKILVQKILVTQTLNLGGNKGFPQHRRKSKKQGQLFFCFVTLGKWQILCVCVSSPAVKWRQ